jgi:hypothetical protein
MEKKLPKIFANKIDKKLNNNSSYYATKDDKQIVVKKSDNNVNKKINNIFNSTRYVYKADVKIVLKDKTITKKVIGKNDNSLITIDNELIPISDIMDIYFVDEKE